MCIMFINNYLRKGRRVLPWHNLGFTQFLKDGHYKLMIAQTQCSQGYRKLVEIFWLKNNLIKVAKYGLWWVVDLNFKLYLGIVCLDNPSYVHQYFSFSQLFVVPLALKGKKYTHYNLVAKKKVWINSRLYSVNSKIL